MPELFVMPTSLIINGDGVLAVIVNALAPALNTIPFTSVFADRDTAVRLLMANVAVSAGPFGTVLGVQFAAVFQSPVAGLLFHVALSPKVLLAVESRSSSNIATTTNNDGNRGPGRGDGTASDIDDERSVVFFIIFPLF